MKDGKRETVGKIATDLAAQDIHPQSAIELEREIHKDYDKEFHICIERGKKEYPGDFYIVVLTQKERLFHNVLRHKFFHRHSCPTPEYDQAVYKYHRIPETFEFLWVVPDKATCQHFREFALQIPESERDLLKFVLEFYDDTLMKLSKKLNGEELETPLLITP